VISTLKIPTLRFLMAAAFIALPVAAFAHPVIIITYGVDFSFSASGLRGFHEVWHFDRVHSQQILQMFDANQNGRIDPDELPALKRGYFDDLDKYNYFTSIVLNGKALPTKGVTDFSAAFENNSMVYRFFVPLEVPATSAGQELDVTVWDPTYYTDLNLDAGNALRMQKPSAIHATISMANDHRHFWQIAPDVVLVKALPFYLKMIVVKFRSGA